LPFNPPYRFVDTEEPARSQLYRNFEEATRYMNGAYAGPVFVATSTTRPAKPWAGMVVYETDTNNLMAWNGSAWVAVFQPGAWSAWTPALTNMTQGNGTILANYVKIGRLVTARFTFILGSTSTMGTGPKFSLPVTASTAVTGDSHYIGTCFMTDVASSIFTGTAQCRDTGTTALIRVSKTNAGGYVGFADITATIPFTWASTYWLDVILTYEAAS
jgi:hypothetical protein